MSKRQRFISRRLIVLSAVFMLIGCNLTAQSDSASYWKKHFDVNGYVKFMQTFSGDMEGEIYDQSLWHNRFNLKFNSHTKNGGTEFYLESRNRIFYGEAVQINSFMKDTLSKDAGFLDLSFSAGDERSFLYGGTFDRLWYKGYYKSWEWSLGRQRINWGINSYWNANDLFNAFTFTDFDYEERPGSDALRIQKTFKNGANLEVASSIGADSSTVGAAKLGWNIWNYDFQIIAGKYYGDYVIGGGWAGGIKDWGFKGETTYFIDSEDANKSAVSLSVSGEYILKGNKFLGLGALYTSNGLSGSADVSASLLAFQASPKSLMPTRWSAMATYGGEFGGLSSYALVFVYLPGTKFGLLMPSITRSVAQNFDLSFHMINVGGSMNNEPVFLANGFVRAKWSF